MSMNEWEHRTEAYALAVKALDQAAGFLNEHADLPISSEGIARRQTALILSGAVRTTAAALHDESETRASQIREAEQSGWEHRSPMSPGECGVPLMNYPCVLPEDHEGPHSERRDCISA